MMFDVIIFDWKRTLYDPDAKALIEGAQEILEYFKNKNTPMILVGKGGDDMNAEVERLGVRKYFSDIIFAEGEKDPNVYVPYIPKDDPTKAVFIGDRVRSELEIGNKLGASTIWVRQGKFAMEEPETELQKPTYTVQSLRECLAFLSR